MTRAILAAIACLCLALPDPAAAQAFPNRPIRIVVPFPAGGSADTLARLLAVPMGEALGQQIIVDNRGGASGTIGTAVVAKSPPDGHNLVLVFDTHAVNPILIPNMPFEQRELMGVSLLVNAPMVIVAHPGVPAGNLVELVALAKAKPDLLNYASVGNGSLGHLTAVLLQQQAGINLTHVPYRGGAPAMGDLVAGQVQLFLVTTLGSLAQIRAGQIKPIAVTSGTRAASLPNVATAKESGYPNFDVSSWFGLMAPAGTPAPIIERLNAEVVKALAKPDVKAKLEDQSLTIVGGRPEAFDAFIAGETARWGAVIRSANIKGD